MNHKIYFYKYCENVVNPLSSKSHESILSCSGSIYVCTVYLINHLCNKGMQVFYLATGSLYVQTVISMSPVFATAQTTWNIKCNHNNGVEYKKE